MTDSPRASAPPLVRLLPMIRRDAETGCWNYTGYITPDGYGQFWDGEHCNAFAHRVAYEQTRGPILPGMTLDHLCRNRACCNPFHVEPVSTAENLRRGNGPSGINSRVRRCPRGHVYDAENTYYAPKTGNRDCKKCRAARQRKPSGYRNAAALRDVRLARGWTQRQIADHVGVDRLVVQRIEAGARTRVDPEVFALLDALLSEFCAAIEVTA